MQIESSIKQEKHHMKMFHNFLEKYPALSIDFKQCTESELAKVLRLFYGKMMIIIMPPPASYVLERASFGIL